MGWKKFGRKLLFPPAWLIAALTVISAVLLTLAFVRGWEEKAAACIIYVLAFYTLSVLCAFCAMVLPNQWGRIKQKLYATRLGNRCMTDRAFRAKVSLHISFAISMLYVGINLWSWFVLRSWWFAVLAVYYVIMAVMRLLLAGYVRNNELGACILEEWRRSRLCAWILLLVNLSLSGAVLMILFQNRGYDYPGIMIYVMAMYTFYSTIHAVVDMIKCRRLGSPVMSTAKIVSFSAALVSILNLETAMFAQFGGALSARDQHIFIILTGAGVSITVVILSVLLIVNATRQLRREKDGK